MEYKLDTFKPMNNRVLIKKDPVYDADQYTTNSGIIVVERDKPKDRYAMATIIKLGQGMKTPDGGYVKFADLWKEGDRVMYYVPAQGIPFDIEGEEYFLIRGEDILQAVIES